MDYLEKVGMLRRMRLSCVRKMSTWWCIFQNWRFCTSIGTRGWLYTKSNWVRWMSADAVGQDWDFSELRMSLGEELQVTVLRKFARKKLILWSSSIWHQTLQMYWRIRLSEGSQRNATRRLQNWWKIVWMPFTTNWHRRMKQQTRYFSELTNYNFWT